MVDSVNSTTSAAASQSSTATATKSLDQAGFFQLLTTQLSYQDPFKPVENAEMLSQMTSMTTADGISNLSKQMESLNSVMTSSQALQASAMVGQNVLLPYNTGYLENGGKVNGVIPITDTTSYLKVTVQDASGQVIKEIPIDGEHSKNMNFSWDGTDKSGNPVKEGAYTFKVTGTIDNKSESLNACVYGKVSSVTLGNSTNPTVVKVNGLGGYYLSDILEIAGTSA